MPDGYNVAYGLEIAAGRLMLARAVRRGVPQVRPESRARGTGSGHYTLHAAACAVAAGRVVLIAVSSPAPAMSGLRALSC